MFEIKPTVTIGIPAYNEAANIGKLLRTLLKQTSSEYRLEKIIVISDGSTDSTVQIVQKLASRYKTIKVVVGSNRQGKAKRLNQLFDMTTSEVIVCLDADIKLASVHTLDHLLKPFENPRVSLVSGSDQPVRESGWFNEITRTFHELWYETRKDHNGGDSVHNIHGTIYALRKSLYKTCHFPQHLIADDHQVYFRAKELQLDFYFAKNARVYFRLPVTLKEYLVQHSRYLSPHVQMAERFGPCVWRYYRVGFSSKMKAVARLFFRKPLMVPQAILLQLLLRFLKSFFIPTRNYERWSMLGTTKLIV